MHKKNFVIGASLLISLITFCSCDHNEISEDGLLNFLEDKYSADFTLVDSETLDSDIRFTFEDENDIEFHVYKEYNQGMFGYSYNYCDDYQVKYLREHTELLDDIFAGDYEIERRDTFNHYESTDYALVFNNYADIAPAIEFLANFLSNVTPFSNNEYIGSEQKIRSERISFSIANPSMTFNPNIYFFYPSTDYLFDRDIDSEIDNLQKAYVKCVREDKIDEQLPIEVLEKYPAQKITNVKFDDKIIFEEMYYNEQLGEYVMNEGCVYKDGRDFYCEELARLAELAGWNEMEPGDSFKISWIRGTDVVDIKSEGSADWTLLFYTNNRELILSRPITYRTGSSPYFMLSESELQALFGIHFEINQADETGEIFID